MSTKLKIKKGDIVKVITGESKGKQGKVLEVMVDKQQVIVEGANLMSKHTKPSAQNAQGGIVKKEAGIHLSNIMVVDNSGKPTRVGRKMDTKTNKSVRYSKKSGEVIK